MVLWTRLIVRPVPQNRMVTKGYWRVVYDRVTKGRSRYVAGLNRKQRKECPANPAKPGNFSNTATSNRRKTLLPLSFRTVAKRREESAFPHYRQKADSPLRVGMTRCWGDGETQFSTLSQARVRTRQPIEMPGSPSSPHQDPQTGTHSPSHATPR
jgi:hypothetical protein